MKVTKSAMLAIALLSPAAQAGRSWDEASMQRECEGICYSVDAGSMNSVLDPVCEAAKTAPPLNVAYRICTEYLRKTQHSCLNTCNIVGAEAVKLAGNPIDATNPIYSPATLMTEEVCKSKPELTTTRQRLHSEWCQHAYVEGFKLLSSQINKDTRMMFGLPALSDDVDVSAQAEILAKEKEEAVKKLEDEKRVEEELKAKEEAEKLAVEKKLAEEKKIAEEKKLAEEKKIAEEKAAAVEAARVESERLAQQEAAIEAKKIQEQQKIVAEEQAAALKTKEAAEIEAAALAAAEAEITP
ncbi:hypothetical protein TL16_g12610 [Triparma laevis f. inornata]|uniref:Uncharacterized protein n=1 Tax=Triparma laevis f. inornata TaxID=1714386 RepID=A0A9W7BTR1_9STRA|nr:hypothetical protein TL16_g12610 [Triparma laevis f. inornata]